MYHQQLHNRMDQVVEWLEDLLKKTELHIAMINTVGQLIFKDTDFADCQKSALNEKFHG